MKRIVTGGMWMIVVVIGVLFGYATHPNSRVGAQQDSQSDLPPPPEWKSQRPAPYLNGEFTMWPNQPTDGAHWSIDDIKKAHQTMADAEIAGRVVEPNSTLHDFPYWTRTHSMFLYHTPLKPRGKTAEQHVGYSQFIVIMGGTGTVQAGGVLQRGTMLQEKDGPIWGELRGSAIAGGETYALKESDWLSIPANVPAQFKATAPGGLSYMVMKINAGLYPWDLIR